MVVEKKLDLEFNTDLRLLTFCHVNGSRLPASCGKLIVYTFRGDLPLVLETVWIIISFLAASLRRPISYRSAHAPTY